MNNIEDLKWEIIRLKRENEELKAVKWLMDGGFYQIEYLGCIGANTTENKNAFLQIDNLPFCGCLGHTSWMTEKPINLKELLDAQEVDK